jgi:hypothetical protein
VFNANNNSLIPITVTPDATFKCVDVADTSSIVVAVSSAPCVTPMMYSSVGVFGAFTQVPGVTGYQFRSIESDGASSFVAVTTTSDIIVVTFSGSPSVSIINHGSNVYTAVNRVDDFLLGTYFVLGNDTSLVRLELPATFTDLPGSGPYYVLDGSTPITSPTPVALLQGTLTANTSVVTNGSISEPVPAFTSWVSSSLTQFMIVGDYPGFFIGSIPTLSAINIRASSPLQASLPVEYVFLGDDEISLIQNAKIDYVITQIQQFQDTIPPGVTQWPMRLEFINPTKELFIVIQDRSVLQNNDWFNFKNTWINGDQLESLRLDFNGETIISDVIADELYLSILQFMNHHTRVPEIYAYCYSFAIDPENHLPTGQVNMSRIYNKNVYLTTSENPEERSIRIYAKSYNILRVQNGLAGVLFVDNNTY